MERLTNRIFVPKEERELVVFTQGEYIDTIPAEMTHEDIRKVLRKLAEYEDLEEQGLLLRLPCKVGDTVWVITSPFNVFEGIEYNENLRDECYESFISSVRFYKNSVQYRINAKVTNHFISAYYYEQDFGKTIFLTKAEAEQKLKEMESDSV